MSTPLPRLSVVTFTNGPVPLVAASLRRLRPLAHEIVVAVDERVEPASLGPLRAVADRLVRAEFIHPLEANLAWLHEQATGDWVLRLDGDDVVGDALLRFLATPGWDDGITHAYLQYRWLWGGPGRMIDQAPWWPDPVLRLIRRVPGIARFPVDAHQPPEVAGSPRLLDLPIYHLDLLIQDEAARAEKVDGYERVAPGRRTDRGWSVSSTYYLPERRRDPVRTAPVPTVDQSAIQLGLAASDATGRPPSGWPAAVPGEDRVVRAVDRRAPPPVAGSSRLRVVAHGPIGLVPGRATVVTVAVTNRSTVTWDPTDRPPTVVGGQVRAVDGSLVGGELRAPLPGPVPSGQESLVRLVVPAAVNPAGVRLEVGLVQEGVAWHDGTVSIGLEVLPARRVLISTGVSTFAHLGDDLITREVLAGLARDLPDVVPVLLAHPVGELAERFGCEVVPSPASLPSHPTGRVAEPGRRSRDLVAQARRMAKGESPSNPAVAAVLAPFAAADALVVAPGGGLASRYLDEALLPTALEVLVARAFDLPVLVEGPSLGPLESRPEQAAVAQIVGDAVRVTVRDPSSADLARRVGKVTAALVVPDPATAALRPLGDGPKLVRRWLDGHGVPVGRPYAVVSLRADHERASHVEAIRVAVTALANGAAAIYLPHRRGEVDDRSLVDTDPWSQDHLAVWDEEDDHAAAALVAGALVTVGSRFHLTVLAAASGVPAVALVADDYDRRRLRGHRGLPGVRIVERSDPSATGAAVTELLSQPRPEPLSWWDPSEFTAALAAVLPPAPRLP